MWENYCIINFRSRWISQIILAVAITLTLTSVSFSIKNHLLTAGVSNAVLVQDVNSFKASTEKTPHTDLCFAVLKSVKGSPSITKTSQCSWANLKRTLPFELNNLKSTHIAFVGDSRIRDIFSYLKSLISGEPFDHRALHHNLEYESGQPRNVLLEFYWMPYPDKNVSLLISEWLRNPEFTPKIVIFGVGAHHIWQFGNDGITKFIAAIKERAKEFRKLSEYCNVVWMPILPIMRGPPTRRKDFDEHRVVPVGKLYGRRFAAVAEANAIPLWNAAYQMAATHLKFFRDHVHFDTPLLKMVTCQLLSAIDPHNCNHTVPYPLSS